MAYNLGQQPFNLQQWSGSSTPGIYGNWTVVDKVPQDMLSLVDAHWYQFPPMNVSFYNCPLLIVKLSNIFVHLAPLALHPWFRHRFVFSDCTSRQSLRDLHFHQDEVAPNTFKSYRCQFGCFWLLDHVHNGTTNGLQLLLWDLDVRTSDVWIVRHGEFTTLVIEIRFNFFRF